MLKKDLFKDKDEGIKKVTSILNRKLKAKEELIIQMFHTKKNQRKFGILIPKNINFMKILAY